ncbi:trifunctional transcriptional activator/DNA repair protein Ada/methylated-DNA--[protein]-cysteine S-methyltransferase [Legionella anisa]|uniref:methylated-DNA--[protein]-cysteine S-methyltransferase n=1 Tax=Legionella anisa TaxID=28082 RepID=A0AAX0WSB4_9GAMM|nr:trifunctional transcriptional activator/DNA repair protein Ada/methylated-DNA--[protein]-cysteine S-methyltransferase [Legionella anisa]AWN75135.1 bifunctional transcriptional activator/DNA repair protein Ada [Legionella anisa]KTC68503.1 Ada protein (O6-methylguanine-DNA methyltransferase) [Legionella anisa]MBN5934482.1 bifunctional transcriptional activator/DNA repair protein Ada [Legionella anisa]MCW8424650.1 trifunctional transcriptional activator/DNA repair protein Ada/methylated-DNA--[p
MLTNTAKKEYYQALLAKDSKYEGIFYVGVKSTGIFCRPTCPAKKPKFENCEFFQTVQEALLASYRPCMRCQPLSYPNQASNLIQKLVAAVEANPEKRWKDRDFAALGVDTSTARRQFKKRFGMTFVAYARARRMGMAMKQIREGTIVIETQLNVGYGSSSGFRDAFSKIMGAAPSQQTKHSKVLKASWFDSPLGPMLAVADEEALYLLEFVDRRGLEREIERLRKKMKAAIIPGDTSPIRSIEKELTAYFAGTLKQFSTPIEMLGSPFQKMAWHALTLIPYGETRSYAEQAQALGKPTAYRAVANANGANSLSIIVPCHRIINSSGNLGGYGGGIARKQWLIEHEQKNK